MDLDTRVRQKPGRAEHGFVADAVRGIVEEVADIVNRAVERVHESLRRERALERGGEALQHGRPVQNGDRVAVQHREVAQKVLQDGVRHLLVLDHDLDVGRHDGRRRQDGHVKKVLVVVEVERVLRVAALGLERCEQQLHLLDLGVAHHGAERADAAAALLRETPQQRRALAALQRCARDSRRRATRECGRVAVERRGTRAPGAVRGRRGRVTVGRRSARAPSAVRGRRGALLRLADVRAVEMRVVVAAPAMVLVGGADGRGARALHRIHAHRHRGSGLGLRGGLALRRRPLLGGFVGARLLIRSAVAQRGAVRHRARHVPMENAFARRELGGRVERALGTGVRGLHGQGGRARAAERVRQRFF